MVLNLTEATVLDKDVLTEASPAETPQAKGEPASSRQQQEEVRPGFVVNDRRFWTRSSEELAEEKERPKLPSYVEQLRQQAEEKDRQLREYIAAYKKEVVEGLEKTKQRLERDTAARAETLRGQMALPLLEVLDALERAILSGEGNSDGASLLEGVKLVQQLMVQKLGELGLKRLETVGRPFDPALHEAVAMIPVHEPQQDKMIVTEIRPGFSLGDRVIRPAMVQVGKHAQ
jgi:molecular chaperone GrpE